MTFSDWVGAGTAAGGLLLAFFAVWQIRRWSKMFQEHGREPAMTFGTVTLDTGQVFPVASLRLRDGAFAFSFPITGEVEAGCRRLVIRGSDGLAVGIVTMDMPAHHARDPMLFGTGNFRVDQDNLQAE
jgi:hypothetical protein